MTKKEAIAVIGFIKMLTRFEGDPSWRRISDRQFDDYERLVNALIDEEDTNGKSV